MVNKCLMSLDPLGDDGTDPVCIDGALLWFDSGQLPNEWHRC